MSAAALALALGASACKSRSSAQCPAQLEDLKSFVRAADEEGGGDVVLPGGAQLVMRDEPPAQPSSGAVVLLEKRYAMMDGVPLGTTEKADALANDLRRVMKSKQEIDAVIGRASTGQRPLRLLVGKDEPWASVVGLLEAASAAGVTEVAFVFDAKSRLTEPPAKIVPDFFKRDFDKTEALAPGAAQVKGVGDLAAKVFSECSSVGEQMSTVPTEGEPRQRVTAMWNAITRGLEQCGCRADMNEVKAMKWAELGRYNGAPRREHTAKIAKCSEPGAAAIEAAAAAPWSQAHAAIVDAAKANKPVCARIAK